MSHHFTPGVGFFVRQPSWHRLERKVLAEWPGDWSTARIEAGIAWEPVSVPVYELEPMGEGEQPIEGWHAKEVHGYQRIIRDDNRLTLGIQSKDYRVISNAEFGHVIESVLGVDIFGSQLRYEGVFELYEGRQVFAVVYLEEPVRIPGDLSDTFRYAVFYTRHDGQGGLRCILTNTRVVCANTANMAEAGVTEGKSGFSIRHSNRWDERVAEVREQLAAALADNQRYYELCTQLATKKVTPATTEKMIKWFLPIGDDMGMRQQRNREDEREVVRTLLKGPTISDEHRATPYGFLQAAIEWSDHYRRHNSRSSYVNRQLISVEPPKAKAFRLAKRFAGVR